MIKTHATQGGLNGGITYQSIALSYYMRGVGWGVLHLYTQSVGGYGVQRDE